MAISGFPENLIIEVLLAVVGVLLLRLLQSLDRATDEVSKLNVTVEKQGTLIVALKDRTDKSEEEIERRLTTIEDALEIVRGRLHEVANKVQSVISIMYINEKKSGNPPKEGDPLNP